MPSPRRRPRRRGMHRSGARVNASIPTALKPPQLQIVPTINTVARYVNRTSNNGNVFQAITSINIMNAGGILATGANLGYPFHGFFKILRIRAWSVPNATTTFAQAPTIGLRWFNTVAGTLGDTNSQTSDTSLSLATPAFIDTKPPVGSAASFWSGPSTNTLFNIITQNTTGVILDIHLNWKINDNANGAVSSLATANTMTVGNTYFPSLDSNNLWIRQGLPSIV